MSELIETIEIGKTVAKIYHDDEPWCPREWDNLSEMVAFSSLYLNYSIADRESTGTEDHAKDRGILTRWYRMQGAEILLFTFQDYGSSGGRLYSTDSEDNADGFFLVMKDKIIEEWGDDSAETRETVRANLVGECKTMGQYVEGDVYGYVVEGEDGDSCWGIFGTEDVKLEAKAAAEYAEHQRLINQEPTDIAEVLAHV